MPIPYIFHQIWLGDAEMHPRMLEWIARWRDLHPNWTHKLWRDVNATTIACGKETLQSRWNDLLQRSCHFAQRSNIWRYELIEQQGGVYLDTDMEPRANIETWLGERDAFITSQAMRDSVSGACFGARKHHPWMIDAVNSLNSRNPTSHTSMGDNFAHELYLRHRESVDRAPCEVFMCFEHRDFAIADRLATPQTLAFHRWSCFWHPTGYRKFETK